MPRPATAPGLALALALLASSCAEGDDCSADEVLCAGECRGAAFFDSSAYHCGACGVSCGAGTCAAGACQCGAAASCASGGCVTTHANGLGQSYLDCSPLDMHALTQAELAADAWNPGGSLAYPGRCPIGCLCSETADEAAVWCHQGSGTRIGWVMLTPGATCVEAFCPDRGYGLAWH